jgi:purine-binding chemotaxis protein CheW
MRGQEHSTSSERSLVGFIVGGARYAVPVSVVREVVHPAELTPIPNAPAFLLGLFDHREEVVPVVALAQRLGLKAQVTEERSKWILVEVRGKAVGLVVDEVTEVFGIEGEARRSLPSLPANHVLGGLTQVAVHQGSLVYLLDEAALSALLSGLDAPQLMRGEVEDVP